MKAWAAEGGGGNFDKRKSGRVADDSMGCRGGGGKF